jgi:hypothetical protein
MGKITVLFSLNYDFNLVFYPILNVENKVFYCLQTPKCLLASINLTIQNNNNNNNNYQHVSVMQLGYLLTRSGGAWRSGIATHHVTKHNTPIHNILSTAPQLSISQKVLGTLPEDGNIMPKHVSTTVHN